MKHHLGKERDAIKRILHRIYSMSDIDKRHSVIQELGGKSKSGLFYDAENDQFLNPGTKERNDLYTREAGKLYTQLAKKTIDDSQFEPSDITHVITVSCTGFFAPGPDYLIVKQLGLSPHTRRYHIGFMGCYAAFPALKMAETICNEDPDALVLIVCCELCTIHLQPKTDADAMISASVFADGAASALVSKKEPQPGTAALRIDGLFTALTSDGEKDMAWTIANNGFDMVLSTYIPDIIEANLQQLLSGILGNNFSAEDFDFWAIHPGGRAILDKVENSLELKSPQIAPSRSVLRDFGNMSSATILFVLREVMNTRQPGEGRVLGMAFGPGLTVETGIFGLIPAQITDHPEHKSTNTADAAISA